MDNFNWVVGDNQYISDVPEAYKEAYKEYTNTNTCEESIKKYDKTDMLINSLVSYLRGLHNDRTDEWLDEWLDYYSRE